MRRVGNFVDGESRRMFGETLQNAEAFGGDRCLKDKRRKGDFLRRGECLNNGVLLSHSSVQRLKMRDVLMPPKAKLLLMT